MLSYVYLIEANHKLEDPALQRLQDIATTCGQMFQMCLDSPKLGRDVSVDKVSLHLNLVHDQLSMLDVKRRAGSPLDFQMSDYLQSKNSQIHQFTAILYNIQFLKCYSVLSSHVRIAISNS